MKHLTRLVIAVFLPVTLAACSGGSSELVLSRSEYQDRLRAFWLSQSIANWTGLQTEGRRIEPPFFTDEDWQDFGYILDQGVWSADDDTDIEYIYQNALETYETEILTPEQIREQWLEHIDGSYIWVSNESAYYTDAGGWPAAAGDFRSAEQSRLGAD